MSHYADTTLRAGTGSPVTGLLSGRRPASLCVAVVLALLVAWQVRTTGSVSLRTLATLALLVAVWLAYGRATVAAAERMSDLRPGLPFQLASGFLVSTSLLFILSLLSPLGMAVNLAIVALGAFVLAFAPRRARPAGPFVRAGLPELLCVVLAGIAATLWSAQAQSPLSIGNDSIVYRSWQDMFFHVRQISAFANAHGFATISDIRLSETSAPLYHFAGYVAPAALSRVGGIPAVDVYAAFQLPFGIFLVGLAAFALVASLWGSWAGLAAAVAVVFLPDAYQQGFGNKYLGHHFLSQVNLGMLYGIAAAALAWLFVIEGTRRGSLRCLLTGYLFIGVCLLFKAHLFVANAFLLLAYPCAFYPGLRGRVRLAAALVLLGIFVSVTAFSQTLAGMPLIRLDFSGASPYAHRLLGIADAGPVREFFEHTLVAGAPSRPLAAVLIALMLLVSTFGFWLAGAALVLWKGARRLPWPVLVLGPMFVANYLAMTMGLALDTRGVGTPDELLNRPLVWAYFMLAAWTAGGAWRLMIGDRPPTGRVGRALAAVLAGSAVLATAHHAENLQTLPAFPKLAAFESFNTVPTCLANAARFVKAHGGPDDTIQDSENDPRFVVTALAERQIFASASIFGNHPPSLRERLTRLDRWREHTDARDVVHFAKQHGISWYILRPSTTVAWPAELLARAAYDCKGYRVYRLLP